MESVVYVGADRYTISSSREERHKQTRRTSEDEGRPVEVTSTQGGRVRTRSYLLQDPTSFPQWGPGYVAEPSGRYAGQQHASLTAPMGRFAKSSSSYYNPATKYSPFPTLRAPIAVAKCSVMIVVNVLLERKASFSKLH